MYVLVRLAVGPLVNGARTRPLCKMMGPSEAGCIAQMGPMTVASSLVSRSSLSANNLKGGLQNGTCQHWYPCSKTGLQKWLPPSSPSPEGMSVASCLSKNLSKMNKLVWSMLLSSYCLCTGPQNIYLHVPFYSKVIISYHPLVLPYTSPANFQSQIFLRFVFLVQNLSGWES